MEKYRPDAFERAAALGPDREAARDAMLESISQKLDAVRDLKRYIDAVKPETPPDEVESALVAMKDRVRSRFPQELLQKAEQARTVAKQFRDAQKSAIKLSAYIHDAANDYDPDKEAEFERMEEQEDALGRQLGQLEGDESVRFIDNWDGLIRSLIRKNRDVAAFRESKLAIASAAEAALDESLSADEITQVVVGAFDIGLVLPPKVYDRFESRNDSESLGMYIPNTPFYIVRDTGKEKRMEQTIGHERVHNLINGVTEIGGRTKYPTHDLAKMSKRYLGLIRDKGPEVLIARDRKSLAETNAWDVIDGQHDELLAGLEGAEKSKFTSRETKRGIFRLMPFLNATDVFSTAGSEIAFARDLFHKLAKKSKKQPEFADQCVDIGVDIEDNFLLTVDRLKSNLNLAKRLGGEASEDVHLLAALLRPSQYGHIRRLLDHKYGEEKVEQAARVDKAVRGLPNLTAVRMAADPTTSLSEEERRQIGMNLQTFDFSKTKSLGIASVDDCLSFVDAATALEARISRPGLVETIESDMWGQFFYDVFWTEIKNDFAGIMAIKEKVPAKHQVQFRELLREYMAEYFESDLHLAGKRTGRGLAAIKRTPHWVVIQELGLEAAVSDAYKAAKKSSKEV